MKRIMQCAVVCAVMGLSGCAGITPDMTPEQRTAANSDADATADRWVKIARDSGAWGAMFFQVGPAKAGNQFTLDTGARVNAFLVINPSKAPASGDDG